MRAAKVRASLRIRAVSPEPSLLAHTSSESRGTFRQKARSLAPLNGWACAVKICHDRMLEDTISLDGAHTRESLTLENTKVQRTVCEPQHDKTYEMTCASNETSDQSGHPSSLITVFAVHSMGSWWPNASSLNREDSDQTSRTGCPGWPESLLDACHLACFVMLRLNCNVAVWIFNIQLISIIISFKI